VSKLDVFSVHQSTNRDYLPISTKAIYVPLRSLAASWIRAFRSRKSFYSKPLPYTSAGLLPHTGSLPFTISSKRPNITIREETSMPPGEVKRYGPAFEHVDALIPLIVQRVIMLLVQFGLFQGVSRRLQHVICSVCRSKSSEACRLRYFKGRVKSRWSEP